MVGAVKFLGSDVIAGVALLKATPVALLVTSLTLTSDLMKAPISDVVSTYDAPTVPVINLHEIKSLEVHRYHLYVKTPAFGADQAPAEELNKFPNEKVPVTMGATRFTGFVATMAEGGVITVVPPVTSRAVTETRRYLPASDG